MLVYLNGRLVAPASARVSVFDHGFLYGDGIYETMRAYDGKLFQLNEHLSRLKSSAGALSLKLPLPLRKIDEVLHQTIHVNKLGDAYVRLQISRGPGEIGLDPALCTAATIVIIAKPFHAYPASYYRRGVKAAIVRTRRNHPLALDPAIKGTNFQNNILAKIEAKKARAIEGIMLNWQGYVAEGTVSNIFVVRNGVLYTPSLDTGILEGVTRNLVLRLARREKVPTKETVLLPKDLLDADECFITNTTMEIMPVTTIGKKALGRGRPGPVTVLLRQAYQYEVLTCLKT